MTRARDVSTPTALVLVKTQTIGTAVSSVTVSGAFSATFDNYKILLTGGTCTSLVNMSLRLGSATTGYYAGLSSATYVSVAGVVGENNSASFTLAGFATTTNLDANIELNSPFLTKDTIMRSQRINAQIGGAGGSYAGFLRDAVSYTSFTFTPSSGTLTGGTIRVYGYQN